MLQDQKIPTTISANANKASGQDFVGLRKEGMELIQRLSPDAWTDHNVHDPGVTLLEELCYAITDLSYRLEYPMVDLLARETADRDPYLSLPPAYKILPCLPVTFLDMRKIILDVPGVQNAWLEKEKEPTPRFYYQNDNRWLTFSPRDAAAVRVAGLYKIKILPEPDYVDKGRLLKQEVLKHWHACRSLGEDLSGIELIGIQNVSINAVIEINTQELPNQMMQEVYQALANYISPSPRFHDFETMLAKGYTAEQLFSGPLLRHGFLEDDDLLESVPRSDVRASDMIRLLMEIPGVRLIKKLELVFGGVAYPWYLKIEGGKLPQLDILGSNIQLLMNGQNVGTASKHDLNATFVESRRGLRPPMREMKQRFPEPPRGKYRELSKYSSIQKQLPQIYGIGEEGLPLPALPAREGAAKQLKAYLLFFEQILSNQHAQLEHFKDLFAYDQLPVNSHFVQLLTDSVPRIDQVLNPWLPMEGFQLEGKENLHVRILEHTFEIGDCVLVAGAESANGNYCVESVLGNNLSLVRVKHLSETIPAMHEPGIKRTEQQLLDTIRQLADPIGTSNERIHRFYDHLLARYGESFPDFSPFFAFSDDEYLVLRRFLLSQKQAFLNAYQDISQARNRAFNLLESADNPENISGLERRLQLLLGLGGKERPDLNVQWEQVKTEINKVYTIDNDDMVSFLKAATLLENVKLNNDGHLEVWDESHQRLAVTKEVRLINGSESEKTSVRLEGWKQCWQWNLSLEGLHLIEHILLRPRELDHESLDLYYHQYHTVEAYSFPDKNDYNTIRCEPHNLGLKQDQIIFLTGVDQTKDVRAVVVSTDATGFVVKIDENITKFDHRKGFWYFGEEAAERAAIFMILHRKISRFEAKPGQAGRMVCHSDAHGLQALELIEVSVPGEPARLYEVKAVGTDYFEIDQSGEEGDWTTLDGIWQRANARHDPYSLQLSFVLPNWPGRMQNDAFRELVESTIRQETPAHLNAYIRWVDPSEMKAFEHHHRIWLAHLNKLQA